MKFFCLLYFFFFCCCCSLSYRFNVHFLHFVHINVYVCTIFLLFIFTPIKLIALLFVGCCFFFVGRRIDAATVYLDILILSQHTGCHLSHKKRKYCWLLRCCCCFLFSTCFLYFDVILVPKPILPYGHVIILCNSIYAKNSIKFTIKIIKCEEP